MWIRSQDKKSLADGRSFDWCVGNLYANDNIVGNYSTEERAIIVLNMIESHINEGRTYVFEMPKE